MAYFDKFPLVSYPFTINGQDKFIVLKDIVLNVRFLESVLARIELFDDYYIKEGATPEEISEILYGNPGYHWTIMLINQKYDRVEDFPIADWALEEYTYKKYRKAVTDDIQTVLYSPKINFGEVLYREDLTGLDCNPDTPFCHLVTNLEYETTINESKRKIKVINPQLIEQTAQDLMAAFA